MRNVTSQVGLRNKNRNVLIALVIHRKQGKTERLIAEGFIGHPEIGTNNRFNAKPMCARIKLYQTTHIHLVGNRHSRHVVLGYFAKYGLNLIKPIHHGVIAVYA